ncbi:13142_t:CDS:2, partial [Entrophospora sp. SA101]
MGCRGDWVLRSITNGDKDEFGMGGRKKGKPSFMIMVYLDRPKGYICRIKRSETMEVPDSPEKFPSILHIIN